MRLRGKVVLHNMVLVKGTAVFYLTDVILATDGWRNTYCLPKVSPHECVKHRTKILIFHENLWRSIDCLHNDDHTLRGEGDLHRSSVAAF